ncbi:MAG: hypothetical protein ACO25B_09020 [Chitinophagaceae bacterium]
MKSKRLKYHYQSAQIYRRHYQASFNLIHLLKSILAVLIHGSSAAGTSAHRHK